MGLSELTTEVTMRLKTSPGVRKPEVSLTTDWASWAALGHAEPAQYVSEASERQNSAGKAFS